MDQLIAHFVARETAAELQWLHQAQAVLYAEIGGGVTGSRAAEIRELIKHAEELIEKWEGLKRDVEST